MKQLQRKLFPALRNRTYTNIQVRQDSTKPETIPNTEHAISTKHISTNTFGSRNYAQVTSQSKHSDNQYHNNSNNDTTEIKELSKQSIKNIEMLTRMISEQNAVLYSKRNKSQSCYNCLQHAKQKIKKDTLKIAAWNSNSLQQRALEIKTFIYNNNIDILPVSETHITTKCYMKIPYYTIYDTNHPLGKAHGGTAMIVRNDIKHYLHSQVNKEYLQATTVTVQNSRNYFQLSAIYVSPRH